MQIHGRERRSQLSLCLAASGEFLLTDERAGTLMRDQIDIIAGNGTRCAAKRSWATRTGGCCGVGSS